MTRIAVQHLSSLLDEAFETNAEHSMLGNIAFVAPEDWDWRPPGGRRTIREIFEHAAIAKHLYGEYLFGPAQRGYDGLLKSSPVRTQPTGTEALVAWAREGHAAFMAGMATLDDGDLPRNTTKHWGGETTVAEAIGVMIHHDAYHAGEINHLRALRQADDRWFSDLHRR